jgi:hypothetical protein
VVLPLLTAGEEEGGGVIMASSASAENSPTVCGFVVDVGVFVCVRVCVFKQI